MKPIGPYVAARDLTGDRPDGAVRTLRATDRLTGMPVLLHVLPHAAPLPKLPAHPALLSPSEGGIDGDTAYVVTELPPHALPVSDPLLAARGALAGLAALHEAGLTHGGVSPAQLWSVDGRVALAGAGLPWGEEATPARDLRDLGDTLRALGGIPPVLRDAPDGVTARDLLARLDAALPPEPARRPGPTSRPPVTPTEPREASPPAPAQEDATSVPVPVPPSTPVVLAAAPPGPVQVGAVEATGEASPSPAPAEVTAEPAPKEEQSPASPVNPTPSRTTSGRVPPRRVTGEPVRIAWDADGTRHVVKPGPVAPAARRRAPGWLLPLLALLLLLLVAGVWWARRSAPTSTMAPTTAVAASGPCCEVRFAVRGVEGVAVRLSVLSAPRGAGVSRGQEVGQAPGVVRLPQPGDYTLRVTAEGYTPGTVSVTAPSNVPVQINLTP
ncbi:pre-peptidase domain-containing protein [Deinococcus aerius]|uniref:Pre-peptidase domain-containing protein n=1 Tax=Deinococcus aerius TaxID=200253 RepID=A0A2I9D126_9DEIO|nr:PEGA domain-containing protein [Deinococcus aerius]GBF04056.1 pre-peptidase domain-containing protein [Deinococcus aerius]